MAELLEQIKKMSREEQQLLVDQIQALWDEPKEAVLEDKEFVAELRRRADNAIHNPQSGIPWAEAKTRLLTKQSEQEQR
ncbi:hypothetical protein IAD21_04318 [Abditibacteriota bacterium]|nr:hypothetical protein IAD21_04318 [Abditibacteriota bacterium]